MKKISVVILTFNEEQHIERCLNSLKEVVEQVFIVDSFSTDKTVELAEALGAKVYQNKWVNYANQFEWGLDNCPIVTEWVMRMDDDEYLEPELSNEINDSLNTLDDEITGIYLKRKVFCKGKWIKYGGFYPHILLRIWRNGIGRIEQRWMDENIVLSKGQIVQFKNDLVDDNLNDITWWVNNHNAYETREMLDLMNIKYGLFESDDALLETNVPQAKKKRLLKGKVYSKIPTGLRAFLYFVYRYVFKLGFLDGSKVFVFHFMQSCWYRLLVDVKVDEFGLQVKSKGIDKTLDMYHVLRTQ
ncbi:glycosyltransferase family 2 protein [Thiosulfativibrio zosterae]|uniref:Glycosyl transferase n=1 Tax=Thiosulfativibrio zosterae TaxID=2675053 RepID=A0A6F8PQU9_9GAMM|nr:glycosyltransferase family 2 protein [Thiosulfativibrio zosterae]BBP44489.1 glycosyl transferase [Thiosulfativibrio zosterae]